VTFRPDEHIRRRADFEAIYQRGTKVSGRLMTVFVRESTGPRARLGIAATRKIGGAVVRNRAKRLTRELFRSHKPTAAVDIVVVPRREFLDASYPTLEREFDALLERAARPDRPRRPRADPRV
jgi:ribonuclease P protein component